MPYALEKIGRKYRVITVETGKAHSKEPMKKKDAEAQLRILNAAAEPVAGGAIIKNCGINAKGKEALNIMQYVDITGISALVNLVDDLSKSDCTARRGYVPPTDEERAEILANERWRSGNRFVQQDMLKQFADQKAGIGRVYTEDELQAAQNTAEANLLRAEAAAKRYDLHQKMTRTSSESDRTVGALKTSLQQQIAAKKGAEAEAAAKAAQAQAQQAAFAKAREKQQALAEVNTGFRTKAIQIAREDFFAQERLDVQAREAALEAERRRNALRASVAPTQPSTAPAIARPTVGFRLPPPVLTPRR